MELYDIYQHPKFGLASVKRGFSWTAFFIPSIWAISKSSGFITLALIVATTAAFNIADLLRLWFADAELSLFSLIILLACIGIMAGFNAYKWHTQSLRKDGFEKQTSVIALSSRHAKKAFINKAYLNTANIAA